MLANEEIKETPIPIENIYYLLAYAWNLLPEADSLNVNAEDMKTPEELFVKLLTTATNRILSKGLYNEYVEHKESIASVKGKLDISGTIKENLLANGKTYCTTDEFSMDILPNQIIKATLLKAAQSFELKREIKYEAAATVRRLNGISDVKVSPRDFATLVIHRNNRSYALLMNLCRFIIDNITPDQAKPGQYKMTNFILDESLMPAIFERFVRNFFARHRSDLKVSAKEMNWEADTTDEHASFIPKMITDITLETSSESLIIDAKFYKKLFVTSYNREKIRSGHLYQLMSYLQNHSIQSQKKHISGMLLYPSVGTAQDLDYQIWNFPVKIKCLDLNRPWHEVSCDLIGIPNFNSLSINEAA